MKKYLYSQHDQRANFYNHPMVSDLEPAEFAETIKRSILLCRDPKQLSMIADCKLCALGSFDDLTGSFEVHEPEIILECDALIASKIENANVN